MSNIPVAQPVEVTVRGFTFKITGVIINTMTRTVQIMIDRPLDRTLFDFDTFPEVDGVFFSSGVIEDWENEPPQLPQNALNWAASYVTSGWQC